MVIVVDQVVGEVYIEMEIQGFLDNVIIVFIFDVYILVICMVEIGGGGGGVQKYFKIKISDNIKSIYRMVLKL